MSDQFKPGGWSDLKQKAIAAADEFGSHDPAEAEIEFMSAITPATVLALIAENERLQADAGSGRDHGSALQQVGSALGLPAGSDLHADCVPKIYSLFTSIGRTTADAAQAHVRFSAERDQLRAEVERLARSLAFTEQWYAVRLERLTDLGKAKGCREEMAAIIANGTVSPNDLPLYARQLVRANHRANTAERDRDQLRAEVERLQNLACAVNSAMHTAGMPVGADPAELAEVIHRLQQQVATLQSDPNSWQSGYDKGRSDGTKTRLSELEQLRSEVEQLKSHCTDWQDKCLKRGFEYVRESDDHYVLADTPEMAALLGELLGIEVRSKDNDSYGETVSELREQLESANASFYRAYELEKENEALCKDAERYRWLRSAENDVAITFGTHAWEDLSDEYMDAAIDAAMGKGGRADG